MKGNSYHSHYKISIKCLCLDSKDSTTILNELLEKLGQLERICQNKNHLILASKSLFNHSRKILWYKNMIIFQLLFLSIHISREQFLAQLIK
jgi:hypothetical protein